ncbi:O-antigen ligase family protein [Microbulbifer yueqingensis]|uniref:O-antigen ligase n=1 Tax=Microbulbifer yueqingensis TaxID=658219 RepID=A0A1G8YBT2_9GAMM|nr:O-antigen ligase family protein [Microbulbifer yueqingensis]SDK00157.1 O-antigen ligase [Microbulbifer yueqingensis]
MSGSSSTTTALATPSLEGLYRQPDSRWVAGLTRFVSASLLLILVGFHLLPEVGRIQTIFYLTLLPGTLLLLGWRRDWGFLRSWQFACFISVPLVLALSTLWADSATATVERDTSFYFKVLAYLVLFYCAVYLVLEQRGDGMLHRWLRWLIVLGTVSCAASLVRYGMEGGFQKLHRIGGISMQNNIDKTAMLYGFHTLFCCYGLSLDSRRWRWLSWTGLVLGCIYIVLSQTKIPIVMAAFAICLAAVVSRSLVLRGLVLVGAFAVLPAVYLLLYGDLPLLHRGAAYSIRMELWAKSLETFLESPWIGNGLVHKQFIELGEVLPHPHNYLLDVARFAGLLGVAACLWQGLAVAAIGLRRDQLLSWVPGTYLLWFGFGVIAMLIYAQQPLVKPSYIWLFYWIPLAVILVRHQLGKTRPQESRAPAAESSAIPAA